MISIEIFKKIFPNCNNPDEIVNKMNKLFPLYNITTHERVASFVAQCGHESGGWRVFTENLNYSANALNSVFPKYFKNAGRDANKYARKPEKIANVVYANRMGNSDEQSGDGWKYRGRGPIQLTGKNNYKKFSKFANVDFVANPDLITANIGYLLLSAIWFWNENNLNQYADKNDIKAQTKRINGGYNGLDERLHLYNEILMLLKLQKNEYSNKQTIVLKLGSKGDDVKELQRLLKINVDGDFGPNTEKAVKKFQSANNLVPDGIVGKKTFTLLQSQ